MGIKYFLFLIFILNFSVQNIQAEISTKTNKYLSILIKRPSSDYLFDKFYSSWLEEATGADLEKFLDAKFAETKNPIYRQIKAYYYEIEGNNELALDIYNDVISKNSSASLLFKRGSLEVHTLEFQKAISDLKSALKQNPNEKLAIQINKLLGKIYIRDEKKDEGLKVWLEMSEKFDDEDLKEEIIELMVDEGLFKEAQKQISELIQKTSNKHKQVTLTLRLGDIFRIQGNKQDALKKYSETLDNIGSGSWLEKEVLSQIDQVFRSEDNLQGLSTYYSKIIESKKNNIEILKRQAALLHELGEKDKALKAYLEIVKLTPLDKENKETYANQLTKSEKFKDALAVIKALIKQYPEDKELFISSAKLHNSLKNYDKCEEDLQAYVKADNESEYSFMRAATLLRSFELKNKAAAFYNKLVEKYPDSREGKLLRALNLYQLDKKEDAISQYKLLGETDNIDEIQRLIMTLNTLKEQSTAFGILNNQKDNFQKSFKFNELFYSSASYSKEQNLTEEAAQRMLNSAISIAEISKACANIIYSAKKVNKLSSLESTLIEDQTLSINQKILLSEIYDSQEDIDSALDIIETEIVKNPKSELLLEQKLRLFKKNHEWDKAIETLVSLSKMTTKRKTAKMKELVDLSLRSGNSEKALEWITKWKKASLSSTAPYIHEAAIYRDESRHSKAAEVLKKAMFKFPDNQTLPRLLAQDYNAAGKYKEAKSVYWRLIGKSEDLAEKLTTMRLIIQISQQEDSTEELIQKLMGRMKNNPKSVFPPLALAELSRYSGSYEDRRKYLIKATEIKSNDLNLLAEIARIEEEEGQYDRALETLNKIKTLDKTKKFANLLPQFYMRSGEEDKAFEHMIESAGGINIPVKDVISTTITLITSNSERTVSFLEPYIIKHPEDYRLKFLLAITLEENGQTKEAINTFLSTLNTKKELPPITKANNPQNNPYQFNQSSYYKKLANHLPQESIDIFISGNKMHRVYSYKRNRPFYGRMPNNLGSTAHFPMPQKINEIIDFVLPHLATLKANLTEEEQQDLTSKLELAGIQYADLRLALFDRQNPMHNNKELWKVFLEKYEGQKTFDSLYAYLMSVQANSPEDLESHFETVKKINPHLAANMVIRTAARKIAVKEEYITFAADFLTTGSLEDIQSNEIAQFLCIDDIPKKYIEPFKKKMLKLHFEDQSQANNWGPYQLIQATIKLKDYESFIKILNHEISDFQKNPTQSPYSYYGYNYNYNYNYNQQKKLIKTLQFPPNSNKSLHPFVSRIFTQSNGVQFENSIDKKKLAQSIDLAESLTLKLLIADFCNEEEITNKVIEQIKNNKKNSLDKNLTIASWYGLNEKYTEAINILKSSRKYCSKKSEMKTVNAAIIFYVESSENKALKEEGRKAGEKLISLRLNIIEKGELAAALESIGYKELANNLDKEIDKAASQKLSITSGSGFINSSRTTINPANKFRELFQQGKESEALKYAAREFRKLAKSSLTINQQSMSHNSSTLQYLVRQIKEKRKNGEFIKLLEPSGDGTFTRKLLERALAYELLKEYENSIADYRAVISRNENSKIAHLRLAFLLASDDLPTAKKHLLKATGSNINFVGPIITSIIRNMYNSPTLFDVYPIIPEVLKDVEPKINQQFYWLTNILQQMENSFHSNEIRLPSLFDAKQTIERSKNISKAIEALKKRNDTYIALSKIALNYHSTAANAFGRLEYLSSIGRIKDLDIFSLAKKALKASSLSGYSVNHTQTIYANNIQVQIKTPEQVYIKTILTKNLLDQEQTFLTELKTTGSRIKSNLEKLKVLYSCEENKFLSKAQEFIKKNKTNHQIKAYSEVISALDSRKLNVSLSDIIVAKFTDDLESANMNSNRTAYISDWTKYLVDNNKKELNDFFNKMLVPLQEKVAELNKKKQNTQNYYFLSSSLQSLFGPCISSDIGTVVQLLSSLDKADLTKEETLFNNSNITYSLSNALKQNPDILDELANSSIFADLAEFNPIPLPSSHEKTSILKVIYNNSRSNNNKQTYLDKLNSKKSKTFGTKLLTTLISTKESQKVYDFMDGYIDEFKQLPESKQQNVFECLNQIMKHYPFESSFNRTTGAFRNLQKNANSSTSLDRIANFLKEDIKSDPYKFTNQAAELINESLQTSPEKAHEIYSKSLSKLKRFYLRNSNRYSNRDSPSEALFNRVRQDGGSSLNKLTFLQKILPSVKFNRQNRFNFNESISNMLRELLYSYSRTYRENSKTKDEANYLAIRDFLKGKSLKGTHISYGAALVSIMSNCSEKELTQLNSYITKQSYENKELELLVQFYKARKKSSNAPIPKKLIEFYSQKLSDENIATSNRLQIINKELLEHLLKASNSQDANTILYKICKLKASVSGNNSDQYYLNQLMEYLFISKENNDQWLAATKGILKHIEKAYNANPSSYKCHDNSYNRATFSFIGLLLKLGNISKAKAIINNSSLRLHQRFETILILVDAMQVDFAVSLFKKNLQLMDDTRSSWNKIKNLTNMQNIKTFYEKLEDQEYIYAAKVFTSFTLQDSDQYTKLAKDFEKQGPKKPELRKKILRFFNSESNTRKIVEPFSSELFESLDPMDVIYSRNNNTIQTYANFLVAKLDSSKTDELTAVVDKIIKAHQDDEYDYYTEKISNYLSSALYNSLSNKSFNAKHYQKNLDKYILLGKGLLPLADEADDSRILFAMTYLFIEKRDGQDAQNKWLDTFSKKYLEGFSASYFEKSLALLEKIYTDENGKPLKSKISSIKISYLDSPTLKRIFPNQKTLKDVHKRITTSLTKNLTTLESLESLSKETLINLLKLNTNKLLWGNLSNSLKKMKNNNNFDPFKTIINSAQKSIPDINIIHAQQALNFVEKLKIEDHQKYIDFLSNIENKPDWLQELALVISFDKAYKANSSQLPEGFIDFYTKSFQNNDVSANDKTMTFRNIINLYTYSPKLLPEMFKSLKESTISNHDKSHALNTLLYIAKHSEINDESSQTLNDLIEYQQKLPTSECTANENSFMTQDLKHRLGTVIKPSEADLKYPETYLQYIHNGDFKKFKELISKHWKLIDLNKNVTTTFRRTPATDKSVEQAFEIFEDQSLKAFAMAFYYITPISQNMKFGHTNFKSSTTNSEGLTQSAEFLKTVKFDNNELKNKSILLLSKNSSAANIIKEELTALIANMPLGDLLVKNSSNLRKAYASHIKTLIIDKKVHLASEGLVNLREIKENNSKLKSSAEDAAKEISSSLRDMMISSFGKSITKAELSELEKLSEITSATVNSTYRNSPLIIALTIKYIMLGDNIKALALAKTIPKNKLRSVNSHNLIVVLKNLPTWHNLERGDTANNLRQKILNSQAIKFIFKGRKNLLKKQLKLYPIDNVKDSTQN